MIQSKLKFHHLLMDWEKVMSSGSYSEGQFVKKFEEAVGSIYDQHAVAFNSAGTALYSVIRSLGCKKVIVPNNTFYATGGMALEAGCEVTLADCGPDFSLSLSAIQQAYNGHDTVILTHVGGGVAHEYKAIADWCDSKGVMLIEDAAHTFGVTKPYKVGSLSRAAVFSFYPTKAVPVGEGGVVVTRDTILATYLREFRNYGKFKVEGRVHYQGSGFNFRMDEWTAVVAASQVKRYKEIMELRAMDADRLMDLLCPLVTWEETNWYKFIAPKSFGAVRTVGGVYQRSDQLKQIKVFNCTTPMPVSEMLADKHVCLPIGEGMYVGKSNDQIYDYLMGKD